MLTFSHRQVLSKPFRYRPTIAAESEYLNGYSRRHLMPTDFARFAHFVQQHLRYTVFQKRLKNNNNHNSETLAQPYLGL